MILGIVLSIILFCFVAVLLWPQSILFSYESKKWQLCWSFWPCVLHFFEKRVIFGWKKDDTHYPYPPESTDISQEPPNSEVKTPEHKPHDTVSETEEMKDPPESIVLPVKSAALPKKDPVSAHKETRDSVKQEPSSSSTHTAHPSSSFDIKEKHAPSSSEQERGNSQAKDRPKSSKNDGLSPMDTIRHYRDKIMTVWEREKSLIIALWRWILYALKRSLKLMSRTSIHIEVDGGLDDPSETGMLFALAGTLNATMACSSFSLCFNPQFVDIRWSSKGHVMYRFCFATLVCFFFACVVRFPFLKVIRSLWRYYRIKRAKEK